MHSKHFLLLPLALVLIALPVAAEWLFDVESGLVVSGYNNVAIPRETGTEFSLSEELETDDDSFFRFRAGYVIGERHYIGALVAPLRLGAYGRLERDVMFNGTEFPRGTVVDAEYRFDSYRLTYRYTLVDRPKFEFGIGGTVKVRDAEISLSGGRLSSAKANTGPVPLVNFALAWHTTDRLSLMLTGDALAASQGRAEDVFAGIKYMIGPHLFLRGGYRILEGGADVEEVYNFAMIHYVAIAALVSL